MSDVLRIAVIGDRFMKPGYFTRALRHALADRPSEIRELELPFPDLPLENGSGDLVDLKEFQGDPDQISLFAAGANVLVNHVAPLSAAMLERLPDLGLLALARGGAVNVDLKAARQRGLTVVTTPARNASAVAEFTLGTMLAETRHIRRGHEGLRQGQWRGDLYRADITGRELNEMTVGVVGYGAIGRRVVRLLMAFGSRVLVCDPFVSLSDEDKADGVSQVDLADLVRQSDIVTLHARLTAQTSGLFNADILETMKPGAFLINTARGQMVNADALLAALDQGQLSGAALETFAMEPIPADHRLLSHERVTLTPHIAGASRQTIRRTAEMIAEEVRRYSVGVPPLHPI